MSFFSRKSASSSSSTLASSPADKSAASTPGNATSDLLSEPVEGVKPTKKWEYNEEQLKQIQQLQEVRATSLLPTRGSAK